MPLLESIHGTMRGGKDFHCRSHADLYKPAVRRGILAICKEFLASSRITATELLHFPAHQQRFVNAGMLYQEVVQRTAVHQIEGSDTPVQTRMRELYGIVDAAMAASVAALARVPATTGDRQGLIDYLRALGGVDGAEQDFTAQAAIAAYLANLTTWPDKLTAAVELARHTAGTPGLAHIDRLIGEIIRIGATTGALFPGVSSLGGLIDATVDWLGGTLKADPGTPAAGLAEIERGAAMPETRAAFATLLCTALARPSPIASGAPAEELAAHTHLLGRLRRIKADFGGSSTLEALAKGFDRLLAPEAINVLLKPHANPTAQLRWLVELHGRLIGLRNQKTIAGHIDQMASNSRHIDSLLREPTPLLVKLRVLAQLHAVIGKAGFSPPMQDRLAQPVEQAHAALVGQSKLMERIDQSPDMASRAVKLIELCSSDILIPDANMAAARQRLNRYLKDASFLRSYLGDDDATAKAEKLAALKRKLSTIGMGGESLQV